MQQYHDADGFGVPHETNFTIFVPTQTSGAAAATLESASAATEASGQVIMSTNLLVNTLLSASLNSLWALMNGLQMIAHLPLFHIIFPANA